MVWYNELTMPSQYYDKNQSSEKKIRIINDTLRGKNLEFYTSSGVFSIKRIDDGTKLLIENCVIEKSWKILDLGCGYGPIGVSLKKADPSLDVYMVDVNDRAVELAKKNSTINSVDVNISSGSLFSPFPEIKFDSILCNPPYIAGRDFVFSIITGSRSHLKTGGVLQIVARHNKGGRMIEKKMNEVFLNVSCLAKGKGYRVYVSKLLSSRLE